MGWTSYPYTPHDIPAEITDICRPWIPLQISRSGSTWYVAAQHEDIITAFVILTQTRNGEWAYKDMDEAMGPNEAKAPISLIAKLTPPLTDYAAKWRERCIAYARRPRYAPGDKLRLTDGREFTVVTYQSRGKTRKCFHHPTIGLCRLSQYSLEGATKL